MAEVLAEKPEVPPAAPAPEAPASVLFESAPYLSLIVYAEHSSSPIQFEDGLFETADPAWIAALDATAEARRSR